MLVLLVSRDPHARPFDSFVKFEINPSLISLYQASAMVGGNANLSLGPLIFDLLSLGFVYCKQIPSVAATSTDVFLRRHRLVLRGCRVFDAGV